ncbi:hypothetical protein AKO1_015801 [Acrasis kona]|uniref:Response regulatory domain-containing protein n=1 Tax=Acrasis kona TaxID=1008807 RepID=A0AAW2ZGT2_9EUKA
MAHGDLDTMKISNLNLHQCDLSLCHHAIYYTLRTKSIVSAHRNGEEYQEELISCNIKSLLCVPIVRRGECMAVLYFSNHLTTDAFTQGNIDLLVMLSSQLIIIWENSKFAALLESENKYRNLSMQLSAMKSKLEEFIDVLCHELRNPLNATSGNVEILSTITNELESKLSITSSIHQDDVLEYGCDAGDLLNNLFQSCRSLLDIVNGVLTVSMLENKSVKLQHVTFNPIDLLHQVMHHGLSCGNHVVRVLPPSYSYETYMIGDPDRIREAIANVIGGVMYCTRDVCELNLKCDYKTSDDRSGNRVKFSVAIVGMNQDDMTHVVKKISATNSQCFSLVHGQCNDLSLVICKELLNMMSSSIHTDLSIHGELIVWFELYLPCSDKMPMLNHHDMIRRVPANSNVLVVDDNPINQKLLVRMLNRSGYQCEVADNGYEAVQKIMQNEYQAVMMDVEMPVMDGLEATRIVRQMEEENKVERRTPIIGVSGNALQNSMAMPFGMQGFITKPYLKKDVLDMLEKCTI